MSGSRAKAIRAEIYGDGSRRNPKDYVRIKGLAGIRNRPDSLRAKYLSAKKEVKS